MPRISRWYSCVFPAGSVRVTAGLGASLLFGLLLMLGGMSKAGAGTMVRGNPGYSTPLPPLNLHDVSYRARWQTSTQRQAEQALEDDAPYLAIRLWQQLAQAGDRGAAYRLGLIYDSNEVLQARNATLAVYWYHQAALAGEIHAQHNLGVAYAKGDGVAMDMSEAIKWWKLAARRGNANSQYNLGTLYVNSGLHDYCAATHWWKQAAKNGVEQATLALRAIRSRKDYRACP